MAMDEKMDEKTVKQSLSQPPKQYISQLEDRQAVDTLFLLKDKNLGVGKNSKPWLGLLLADKSGVLDGRIWEKADQINKLLNTGDIVRVKGQIQFFQNRKQLVIHKIDVESNDQIDMNLFVQQSSFDAKDMYAELSAIVKKLKDEHIKQLLFSTLEDPEIKERLLKSPAAKSIHHAWFGGLLEHILSICHIMEFMAKHYKFLNFDLLIFGAIYHDIGKIWELNIDHGIQYTDRGRLLGHLMMSVELIEKKASRILGFPDDLKDICKHIVLSHHGTLEYGSPKRPKFLEAVVVNMVDNLDSRVATLHQFLEEERHTGEKWSKYNQMFDRYFLLTRFDNETLGKDQISL